MKLNVVLLLLAAANANDDDEKEKYEIPETETYKPSPAFGQWIPYAHYDEVARQKLQH